MRRSLAVGLRDTLADCVQERPLRQQMPMVESEVEVVQCSDQLPMLTDDDVTDLLRGLEETFSVAEVEELLRGLEETSTVNEGGNHYVDDEVKAVMSMDINDFIV